MRRLFFGAIALLLFSVPGFAQEYSYPKVEVFGGFSITSMGFPTLDPTTLLPTTSRENFYGWQSSIDGNVSRHPNIYPVQSANHSIERPELDSRRSTEGFSVLNREIYRECGLL